MVCDSLRLIVGFGFMQHGFAKLARGPEDFIGILHAIGVPLSAACTQGITHLHLHDFTDTIDLQATGG
jgi:uncharacterized membrane protein YphA (DoxX/SURF4 family)